MDNGVLISISACSLTILTFVATLVYRIHDIISDLKIRVVKMETVHESCPGRILTHEVV